MGNRNRVALFMAHGVVGDSVSGLVQLGGSVDVKFDEVLGRFVCVVVVVVIVVFEFQFILNALAHGSD